MFKKTISLIVSLLLFLPIIAAADITEEEIRQLLIEYGISAEERGETDTGTTEALQTVSGLKVNGVSKNIIAYNILDNNYFKLRGLAYVLSGTEKQFEVVWDGEKNAINLISGKAYTPVGGETESPETTYSSIRFRSKNKVTAVPATAAVFMDGKELQLTAYNIAGNNYFKLRDLAQALDFSVEWNQAGQQIELETMFGYVPEEAKDTYALRRNTGVPNTSEFQIGNWSEISPLQQFSYKNEGLGYAYVKNEALTVALPSRTFTTPQLYPLLGDVIADAAGNFYVVWGRSNETGDASVETIFISKYSESGQLVKTTGFVGKSSPWHDSDSAKTKTPFRGGGCVSAIDDKGILVNYHSKTRYDGHQSDNVIAVDTDTMEPYTLPNDTYSGHSFGQDVIYSEKIGDFLFASQGDAYSRGFRVNTADGKYGDDEEILFHFYLQSNANYDMWIVNKTFAQLGGLTETSAGAVLAGASAKTIGAQAEEERQNLFVQIFDPTAEAVSPSMFVGGTTRSGATAFDINDNQNSPLTPVTDYGVIWLTDYTEWDVVAPRVVRAEDRIVMLWNENREGGTEAFYTVLSAAGETVTAPTSLGRLTLNSYEAPIYHDGKVCWAASNGERIRVYCIDISK